MLRRRGVDRVRPLEGGFGAWREHGLPVQSKDGHDTRPEAPAETPPAPKTLGEAELLDESGQTVRIDDLWQDRSVILAFVRQFGCLLCREFVVELRDHTEAIRELGADVLVVGNGEPEAAARFRELFELDFPVLVDPNRRVFELLGFRRNLGGSAHPGVFLAAGRAWLRGARQGRTAGDPWQLGGVLIARPGGEESYRHVSRFAGDHPKIDEILCALRSDP